MRNVTIMMSLPDKLLSPNHPTISRRGRMAKHAAARDYRATAKMLAMAELKGVEPPKWRLAALKVAWYAKSARYRPDPDNIIASLKAAIDGLRDAGVLADDREIVIYPPLVEVDKEDPRVLLHVEPMEERP